MTSPLITSVVFVVVAMLGLSGVNAATTTAAATISAAPATTFTASTTTSAAPTTTGPPMYRCYHCNSEDSPWCGNQLPLTPPANATYCNGTSCSTKKYSDAGPGYPTERDCASVPNMGNSCLNDTVVGTNVTSTTCNCLGDLCNGAAPSVPTTASTKSKAATLNAASSSIVMSLAAATGVVLLIATRRLY